MISSYFSHLLLWLDARYVRYATVAWSSFGVLVITALLPFFSPLKSKRAWWEHPAFFAVAIFLCSIAFRWPSLVFNREIANPDESQLIAAAITLSHDPLFFRSVDGTTCGPVDEIPLTGLALLGLRLDYQVSHSVALCLSLLGIGATWLALRRILPEAVARLAILPVVAVVAFCDFWDFLQLSTEQFPAAIIAIAVACMLYAWNRQGQLVKLRWLGICGLLLGIVPFAKPQGSPVAFYCGISALALVIFTPEASWHLRRKALGLLIATGLAMPLLFLAGICFWGQWGEFTRCYIINNLQYASGRWNPWSDSAEQFLRLVDAAWGFKAFCLPELGFIVVSAVVFSSVSGTWVRRLSLFSFGQLLVSLYAMLAPGRDFPHYLQFIIFPLVLCAGIFFEMGWARLEHGDKSFHAGFWSRSAYGAFFLGLCVVPQVLWKLKATRNYVGSYTNGSGELSISEPAREVLRYSKPTDSIAIWGWTPRLYVETNLRQGTRDGNTSRQVEAGPMQAGYQARFLKDLKRNKPAIFLDAVGGQNFMSDRKNTGHEVAPAINAYISDHYRLLCDVDGSRIYQRNDLPKVK